MLKNNVKCVGGGALACPVLNEDIGSDLEKLHAVIRIYDDGSIEMNCVEFVDEICNLINDKCKFATYPIVNGELNNKSDVDYEIENKSLAKALYDTNGSIQKASELLGICQEALLLKMHKFGLRVANQLDSREIDLDISIDSFIFLDEGEAIRLKSRTLNYLNRSHGVKTLRDLLVLSKKDILYTKNLGRKSLDLIERNLSILGFTLRSF